LEEEPSVVGGRGNRRLEAKKIRGCGPSAFGDLREALSAALGWRQERERG
jgi:hypothetical protein